MLLESRSPFTSGANSFRPTTRAGAPLITINGRVYYNASIVNGERIALGDAVQLHSQDGSQPYLGLVRLLWEHVGAPGRRIVVVRWFYRPEDTHCGRRARHKRNEVFLSEVENSNELQNILSLVAVEFGTNPVDGTRKWFCVLFQLYFSGWSGAGASACPIPRIERGRDHAIS